MYKQLQERDQPRPPVNVSTLMQMKADGEPIACLTAYDASFARVVDDAGTDIVLVGDSLGMVMNAPDVAEAVAAPVAGPHMLVGAFGSLSAEAKMEFLRGICGDANNWDTIKRFVVDQSMSMQTQLNYDSE